MAHPSIKPETLAARALGHTDPLTGAINPPLHLSSTFVRAADNSYPLGRVYARADNPAFDEPQQVLAQLEKGEDAMLFASGMAAATAAILALVPGDHVVAPKVMYWSLRNWLGGYARGLGIAVDFVDMSDLVAVKTVLRPGTTKLVWAETPANPLWDVTDIAAVAEAAHAAGARLIVDSTVATPVFTLPLDLGADLVMHSATKYLNGHSDVVAGALVTKTRDAYWERLRTVRVQIGGILGAFEAWLLLRGMRTLYPRVKTAAASAQFLAEQLEADPNVLEVLYPGLPSFKGHALAARQMQGGFGAMLSVRVKGGEKAAIATAARLEIWKRATSLGGVESLVEHRASVEGPGTPCPPDLLRLSVGIEDAGDLLADMKKALAG